VNRTSGGVGAGEGDLPGYPMCAQQGALACQDDVRDYVGVSVIRVEDTGPASGVKVWSGGLW